ncbi:MAG: GDP-mannose 4,6-dehydratase [Candidatus Omnitrophica bacterium]|nr:GDP-mannose 4,6-dehydratase [Candidatus Omnitrophota bacterium]
MGSFWKGKRVLVTGADGFMGSHLTERLVAAGAKVSVYIRGNSISGTVLYTLKHLQPLQKKLKNIITGNIASLDSVSLIRKDAPAVIFHLAADAYVPNSFDHPREVMESNLIGTMNVLDATMGMKRIERVVCTSSSEIYGTARYAPIDEAHPLNPTSPYAASKVAADRIAYSYFTTYGLPVAIIRPFNTYGPRHTYDVIPKFIRLALENQPLTIYGNGRQSRDFTYVRDMIEAFLVMGADRHAIGRAVNFGTGHDVNMVDLARLIKKLTGSRSEIIFIPKRKAEVQRLICDARLAGRLFGWKPAYDIEQGLKENIQWARSCRAL